MPQAASLAWAFHTRVWRLRHASGALFVVFVVQVYIDSNNYAFEGWQKKKRMKEQLVLR
jgi:hypothetical protein